MNHVMIDLETMGLPPRAVIASVGACYFDPMEGTIGARFYQVVDLESCAALGLEVTGSTVAWWLQQSDEARAALLGTVDNSPSSLGFIMAEFAKFLGPPSARSELQVWGNGPTFDLTILREAWKVTQGDQAPWSYRRERCVRTVVALYEDAFGDVTPKTQAEKGGPFHHALDDALAQARYVSEMHGRLVRAGAAAVAEELAEELDSIPHSEPRHPAF